MHLTVRSSDEFPSGLKLFTVHADNTEVPNPSAQRLWENAPSFERPVHLKVLRHRTVEPIMVVQFVEFGYSCVFQESNGVAQWCMELAEDDTCPDDLINSLRRHPLLSDHLLEIEGDRYNQILTLTQIPEVAVPLWISEATVDNAHEVDIYFEHIKGVLGNYSGFMPVMVSLDAQLSRLFLTICGLSSPHKFILKYRGGPGRTHTRYEYEEAVRHRVSVRDANWPLNHAVWIMTEPRQQNGAPMAEG